MQCYSMLSVLLSVLLAACFLYCFLYISISIVNSIMTQVNEEISDQSDALLKVIKKKKKSRPVTAILNDVSSVSTVYSSLHIFKCSAVVTLSQEVNTLFNIFNLLLFINLLNFIS